MNPAILTQSTPPSPISLQMGQAAIWGHERGKINKAVWPRQEPAEESPRVLPNLSPIPALSGPKGSSHLSGDGRAGSCPYSLQLAQGRKRASFPGSVLGYSAQIRDVGDQGAALPLSGLSLPSCPMDTILPGALVSS